MQQKENFRKRRAPALEREQVSQEAKSQDLRCVQHPFRPQTVTSGERGERNTRLSEKLGNAMELEHNVLYCAEREQVLLMDAV